MIQSPSAPTFPMRSPDIRGGVFRGLLAVLLMLPMGPAAQITIESGGNTVIEIDPGDYKNQDKSLGLALLFSAILPGTGEYYLQDKQSAKAFWLTEAGFWAALFTTSQVKRSYLQSSRSYASRYGGIDAGGKDLEFLELMAAFRSYQEKEHRQDSYELAQVLSGRARDEFEVPSDPSNYWDFGSAANPENTRNWKTYQSSLRHYRGSQVAVSFAIGALALDRLASMVNTLHTYRTTSRNSLSFNVIPELGPHRHGASVAIGF